jgi:hypothetical protein
MTTSAQPTIAIYFKPVPGGFVYQAPGFWLTGSSNRYFVTARQKTEITELSKPPGFFPMFGWMLSLVLLGLAATLAINWYRHDYRFDDFTAGDTILVIATTLLAMLLAIKIAYQSQMKRLQPLLATLPKSDIVITRADYQRAFLELNDSKALRRQAELTALIAAVNLAQLYFQYRPGHSVLSGDPISILFAVVACLVGAVALLQFRQAIQKAKQKRDA